MTDSLRLSVKLRKNLKGETAVRKNSGSFFNKKIKLGYFIIICLLLIAASVTLTYALLVGGFGSKEYFDNAKRYVEIEKTVSENYIGDVEGDSLYEAACNAMVRTLNDKWSYYMTPEQYEAYKLSSANEYAGIGVTIQVNDDGEIVIMSVQNGTPAATAGLAAGDVIINVAGEDVSGESVEDVGTLIRSKLNKDFEMTVLSDGDEKTVTINCEIIYKSPVSNKLIDGSIGYIKIENFEAGASEETIAAIEYLIDIGAKSFIFDVRNNPGGLVSEMCEILDYILPDGDLFISIDKDGNENITKSDKVCLKYDMVVLVNSNSYSAAEFFAAALQEYNWATVMGEQTTGKSRSQITIELSDGSAVHISTKEYLTPKRVDLAEVGGITPDVTVVNESSSVDSQLEKAISQLKH